MADDSLEFLKLPPHSVEAEQSVLGGLLLENDAWDRIADIIGTEDFYRHDHRLIYEHISRLVEHSKPADMVTVDCEGKTTREINQALRRLAAEGVREIAVLSPGARHNLGVALFSEVKLTFRGSYAKFDNLARDAS